MTRSRTTGSVERTRAASSSAGAKKTTKASAAKPPVAKAALAKKATAKKAATKKTAAKKAIASKPNAKTKLATSPKAVTSAATPLPDALPVLPFADARAWESWLTINAKTAGLWLKIAKKSAGIPTVSYEQALDVALCHGWIDGQKRGFDENYFLQRFTPRRPKGLWSKINIAHIERLIAAGRMREGGLREVEAAKADGRWAAAYDGASRMEVPEALAIALRKNKAAAAFFETLDKTNRYSVCWRVQTAKTEATRASRVETLVAMLARGEKIHG